MGDENAVAVEVLPTPDAIAVSEEDAVVRETRQPSTTAAKQIDTQPLSPPEGAPSVSPVICTPPSEQTRGTMSPNGPPIHPLDNASPLSILYLSCLDAMIWLGAKRPLQESDIPACPSVIKSKALRDRLSATMAANPSASFSQNLWRTFRTRWLMVTLLDIIFVTCAFLQPFWLGALLEWMADKADGRALEGHNYFMGASTGYTIATGLVVTTFMAMTTTNHAFYHMALFGVSLRSSIMLTVYDKSMRLAPEARRGQTTGSIVTMMSVDAERVYQGAFTSQWLWMGPVVILGSAVLTIRVLGLAGLVGAVCTFATLFFQVYMGKASGVARSKLVHHTDERIKLTNEVLQGIRVIKLYSWEKPIRELVDKVRQTEVRALARLLLIKLMSIVTLFLAPTLISVLTFTVYFALNQDDIRLDRVFAGLAFINIIRLPMSALPQATSNFADLRVAMKRIDRFMGEKELSSQTSYLTKKSSTGTEATKEDSTGGGAVTSDVETGSGTTTASSSSTHTSASSSRSSSGVEDAQPGKPPSDWEDRPSVINIEDATFSWNGEQQLADDPQDLESRSPAPGPTLTNVNLNIKEGQLVCIVGPVGAGKSSLVAAILGEIPCLSGTRSLNAKVAYVSQEAWIQNKSVRNCILFDRPYNRHRYRKALKSAQLYADLAMLPSHDATEIGERGINLSGGQKARVSLARALNEEGADIYILDDPLSAVDAHVSKAIFKQAIQGSLFNKTRVLVLSSNYHFLPSADHIVVIEAGAIIGQGTFSELVDRFPRYLCPKAQPQQEPGASSSKPAGHAMARRRSSVGSLDEIGLGDEEAAEAAEAEAQAQARQEEGQLIGKEERDVGSVSAAVWVEYFSGAAQSRLGGALLAVGTLSLFAIGQALRVGVDYVLAQWSEKAELWSPAERTARHNTYTAWYWSLGLLTIMVMLGRTLLVVHVAIKSCSTLHSRLLAGVLRAPVNRYFDVTPVGRILNRFSKDLDAVDQPLPETMMQMVQNLCFVASIVVLCLLSTAWFLLFLVPILLLFGFIYYIFGKSSRELKRLEGLSRSPIYSSFSEMLQGIETIRAFHRQTEFVTQHVESIDKNASLFVLFWLTSRWLAIRLDFLAVLVMLTLSFLAAVLVENGRFDIISPAMLSLALIYCLQLTGLLQWTIRLVVETENYMTAVERLTAFLQLPCEAPGVTDVRPPPEWPHKGSVEISDVVLRYRDGLDTVLKGLTLSIQGGEKIGVCGRTGAGKSSLTQALFRIVEAEGSSRLVIDGIDIRTLGLDDLRSRLTVIPQDPVLFSGTLRFNLDPTNERTDHEIWEALRRVHLEADVRGLPHQLHSVVAEKGGNLSLGQRQLLCIARALLRRSRILVMDEATASVDSHTDRCIQETLRTNFAHCTVLCIAHRLDTIIDFDKIAVLDQGRVVEFDHPARLLMRETSVFKSLVAELGPEGAEKMKQIAMQALQRTTAQR